MIQDDIAVSVAVHIAADLTDLRNDLLKGKTVVVEDQFVLVIGTGVDAAQSKLLTVDDDGTVEGGDTFDQHVGGTEFSADNVKVDDQLRGSKDAVLSNSDGGGTVISSTQINGDGKIIFVFDPCSGQLGIFGDEELIFTSFEVDTLNSFNTAIDGDFVVTGGHTEAAIVSNVCGIDLRETVDSLDSDIFQSGDTITGNSIINKAAAADMDTILDCHSNRGGTLLIHDQSCTGQSQRTGEV